MEKFKVGDVVQLASGGPTMTVVGPSLTNKKQVKCQWFVKDEVRTGEFLEDALVTPSSGIAIG
jgi:uncharacterized protein YodC (DUF2158 family)